MNEKLTLSRGQLEVEIDYQVPKPVLIDVFDPDGRRTTCTPKVYEALFRERGWTLVDPVEYARLLGGMAKPKDTA